MQTKKITAVEILVLIPVTENLHTSSIKLVVKLVNIWITYLDQ